MSTKKPISGINLILTDKLKDFMPMIPFCIQIWSATTCVRTVHDIRWGHSFVSLLVIILCHLIEGFARALLKREHILSKTRRISTQQRTPIECAPLDSKGAVLFNIQAGGARLEACSGRLQIQRPGLGESHACGMRHPCTPPLNTDYFGLGGGAS